MEKEVGGSVTILIKFSVKVARFSNFLKKRLFEKKNKFLQKPYFFP